MTLQQICVSPELAKQLRDAGYPQESFFYWWVEKDLDKQGVNHRIPAVFEGKAELPYIENIAAPTAAEIGEQLPEIIRTDRAVNMISFRVKTFQGKKEYLTAYHPDFDTFYADTEADSRAKMWLHLKAINLIKEAV